MALSAASAGATTYGVGMYKLAAVNDPSGVAYDSAGNLYVSDANANNVERITPAGASSVFAGDFNGNYCYLPSGCGDGGAATDALLNNPTGLAVDGAGDVLIADAGDNQVREVSPGGTITTFAGTGHACTAAPACGDGGQAKDALLNYPNGLAVDSTGNVYIADTGDNEIRKVAPDGTISRVAGSGIMCPTPGACAVGGSALSVRLRNPWGVSVDPSGDLFISDTLDSEVDKVTPGGTISRFAGTGVWCTSAPSCGDGGSAVDARLSSPEAVAISPDGSVYIADYADEEIRLVSAAGTISRFAGSGAACDTNTTPGCGDGELATDAQLGGPWDVTLDLSGRVVIADGGDNEVRRVAYGPVVPPPPPPPPYPVVSGLAVHPHHLRLNGVRHHGRCVVARNKRKRRHAHRCRQPIEFQIDYTLNTPYNVRLAIFHGTGLTGYCTSSHKNNCPVASEFVDGAAGVNHVTWKPVVKRRLFGPGPYFVQARVTANPPMDLGPDALPYISAEIAQFRITRR